MGPVLTFGERQAEAQKGPLCQVMQPGVHGLSRLIGLSLKANPHLPRLRLCALECNGEWILSSPRRPRTPASVKRYADGRGEVPDPRPRSAGRAALPGPGLAPGLSTCSPGTRAGNRDSSTQGGLTARTRAATPNAGREDPAPPGDPQEPLRSCALHGGLQVGPTFRRTHRGKRHEHAALPLRPTPATVPEWFVPDFLIGPSLPFERRAAPVARRPLSFHPASATPPPPPSGLQVLPAAARSSWLFPCLLPISLAGRLPPRSQLENAVVSGAEQVPGPVFVSNLSGDHGPALPFSVPLIAAAE